MKLCTLRCPATGTLGSCEGLLSRQIIRELALGCSSCGCSSSFICLQHPKTREDKLFWSEIPEKEKVEVV